jgi:hypothetical protein
VAAFHPDQKCKDDLACGSWFYTHAPSIVFNIYLLDMTTRGDKLEDEVVR